MNENYIYILAWIACGCFLYTSIVTIYLIVKKSKIDSLERKLKKAFQKRSNLALGMYVISKNESTKINDIFKNILDFRKIEIFSSQNMSYIDFIKLESKIHYELSFIIRYLNNIDSLKNNNKLIYLNEETAKISEIIWLALEEYKRQIKQFNKIHDIKKYSVLWILIPIKKFWEI